MRGAPSAKRRSARRLLLATVLLAAAWSARGAGPAGFEAQPPADGAVETTLALLRYNRVQCVRLAADVQRHWRELPLSVSGDISGEERVRARVLEELLGDLAAARAAGDLARAFLPTARAELDAEASAALDQLFALQSRLCDTVAYPSGGRAGFGGTVTDLMLAIDREVAHLGRLLVVPEAELDAALEPYLTAIQIAGVEAQGELMAYLASLEPTPPKPSKEQLMAAWHARYREAVRPSKEVLGRYLQARTSGDSAALRDACRELGPRARELLDTGEEAFRGPEPSAAAPLTRAFRELSLLAGACNGGDFRRADRHLQAAQRHLGTAAAILRPYGLEP